MSAIRRISLTGWIIIALLLGVAVGAWYHENHPDPAQTKAFASELHLLSDIFLRLIKMIVAPLVFSLLLTGIAKGKTISNVREHQGRFIAITNRPTGDGGWAPGCGTTYFGFVSLEEPEAEGSGEGPNGTQTE